MNKWKWIHENWKLTYVNCGLKYEYQVSFISCLSWYTASTAMVIIISYFSPQFTYTSFHLFTFVYSPPTGFYTNSQMLNWLERCAGIAWVMSSSFLQAWIFFPGFFFSCSSWYTVLTAVIVIISYFEECWQDGIFLKMKILLSFMRGWHKWAKMEAFAVHCLSIRNRLRFLKNDSQSH